MTDEKTVEVETEFSKPKIQTTNSFSGPQQHQSKLRTLTRLIIGGLALTMDQFTNQITEWNAISDNQYPELQSSIIKDESTIITSQSQDSQESKKKAETTGQLTRYALIGIVFSAENKIRSGLSILGRLGSKISRKAKPITKPITQSSTLFPVRKRYTKLVNRGETQVSQWINLGREEEKRSRELVQVALNETLDTSIEYLADNAEIQDLIQSQGTGLANEIVEEIRERTVSADTLVENIIRSALRLTPRSEISGPPIEIRFRALSTNPGSQTLDESENVDGPTPR